MLELGKILKWDKHSSLFAQKVIDKNRFITMSLKINLT